LKQGPSRLTQATWSNPATNRLLFEAGATYGYNGQSPTRTEGVTRDDISVTELSTGLVYGSYTGPIACCAYGQGNRSNQANERFSVSYITGSHALKTGLFLLHGFHDQYQEVNGSIAYTFRNQVPDSLTQYAVPYRASVRLRNLGLYAQDQWTVRKLTLNLGVRFDSFNGYNLDQDVEAGLYVDARHFDRVDNVPNWKDVSPRIGAAYDLFGNGKTAVKASIGRYVSKSGRRHRRGEQPRAGHGHQRDSDVD